MDAHRKLTDNEADEALRALFAEHGTAHTPEGIDTRIMVRIMATQVARSEVVSLIPRSTWIGIGMGVLALALYILLAPDPATSTTDPLFAIPSGLLDLLGSKWTLMAVVSGGLLLLFNAYLTRMRTTQMA